MLLNKKKSVDLTIFTAVEDTDVSWTSFIFLPFRTQAIPVNPLPNCHKGHRYRLQTQYLDAWELVSTSDVFLHYCLTAMCRLCYLSIAMLSSVSIATHSSSDICLKCPGSSSIQNHNGIECVNTFKHKFDSSNVKN
jgi:hypothetical protein